MIERFLLRKLGPEKMAEEMVQKSCSWVYKIFIDKKFRQYTDFANLTVTEQDRIFNELVVSALILTKKIVNMVINEKQGEDAEFYWKVKKHLFDKFIDWLKELNIDQRYIDIWKKLIDLRENDYEEAKNRLRSEMMDDKKLVDLVLNPKFIMVHTIAIECYRHITRGKGKPDNPLYKMVLDQVANLNKRLEKLI